MVVARGGQKILFLNASIVLKREWGNYLMIQNLNWG
jgi:hypothetical protein